MKEQDEWKKTEFQRLKAKFSVSEKANHENN